MRSKYLLLFISFVLGACTPGKELSPQQELIYNQGMKPLTEKGILPDDGMTSGLVQVLKGNTFTNGGIFISEDGLLLTNYTSAIEQLSAASTPEHLLFTEGFIADSAELEIPLTGVSLRIEVRQTDVTEQIQGDIDKNEISGYKYNIEVQERKDLLISELSEANPGIVYEVKDLFSGNQQILYGYKVIRDIRLVYSPAIPFDQTGFIDTRSIYNLIDEEYVILKAYVDTDGSGVPYSELNVPYSPEYYFGLSDQKTIEGGQSLALGFPGNTYRLEPARAIDLYYNHTNNYVIGAFNILLDNQEQEAASAADYSYRSLPARLDVALNILIFNEIQQSISENKLFELMEQKDETLKSWIDEDSVRMVRYLDLYWYIDEAYDLALQTADIFYVSSYFRNMSQLDDLALPLKISYEKGDSGTKALSQYQEMLPDINKDYELDLVIKFLGLLRSMPENQWPLTLYDFFENDTTSEISSQAINQIRNSALFEPEKMEELLYSGNPSSDLLYALLEEIIFSQEMATNNISKYLNYGRPAQQVYAKLQMEAIGAYPDGNTNLRYNKGSISHSNDRILTTTNDFSGRAQGSAIIDESGTLIGMVTEEINSSLFSNYYYKKETSYLKALKVSAILDEIRSTPGSEFLLKNISR